MTEKEKEQKDVVRMQIAIGIDDVIIEDVAAIRERILDALEGYNYRPPRITISEPLPSFRPTISRGL